LVVLCYSHPIRSIFINAAINCEWGCLTGRGRVGGRVRAVFRSTLSLHDRRALRFVRSVKFKNILVLVFEKKNSTAGTADGVVTAG